MICDLISDCNTCPYGGVCDENKDDEVEIIHHSSDEPEYYEDN